MLKPLAKPVMSAAPSTPSAKQTNQVAIALLPWRLRSESTLISNPAIRKSMPKPSSFSSGMPPSLPDASPSTFGPMSTPQISKNTTSGMRLPVSRDMMGESSAAKVTQKIETYCAVPSTPDASCGPAARICVCAAARGWAS